MVDEPEERVERVERDERMGRGELADLLGAIESWEIRVCIVAGTRRVSKEVELPSYWSIGCHWPVVVPVLSMSTWLCRLNRCR